MKTCQGANKHVEKSKSVGVCLPEAECGLSTSSCLYLLPIKIVLQSLCVPGHGWGGEYKLH